MTAPAGLPAAASAWLRARRGVVGRLPHVETMAVFERETASEGRGAIGRLGFDLVEMSPSTLGTISPFRRRDQVNLVRRHLETGGRGWWASRDGEVAAYACLVVPPLRPERHRYLLVYPGEASGILMFTRPEFRGLGLGRGFLQELGGIACIEHGAQTMVGWTASHNRASCRMHLSAGFAPAGTVDVLIVWYRPVKTWTRGGRRQR